MKLTKVEENRIRKLLKTDPERGLHLAMDHFGPAVKWIAKTILGAEALQDVEECIAETFVRLWRSVAGSRSSGDGFDEEAGSTLYSYTCGIARHVAIDMVRRRPKETPVAEAIETDFDPDFAEELAAQENREAILHTVEGMESPDREIFLLRYWMELPVKRIAEILELTEKQVENRLYRGKKVLRKQLAERGIIQ